MSDVQARNLSYSCDGDARSSPLLLQGNTEAWFHLGVMHLNGWGVPRNVMQAQYFFSMTAKTVRHALRK